MQAAGIIELQLRHRLTREYENDQSEDLLAEDGIHVKLELQSDWQRLQLSGSPAALTI